MTVRHEEFTDKIGDAIVSSVLEFCKKEVSQGSVCCYWNGMIARTSDEVCHAPAVYNWRKAGTDVLGVVYRGGGLADWKGYHHCTEYLGPEARDYLVALINPQGAFRALLPYMWKTDPDEIIADKCIVFKNLNDIDLNAKLLWTFAQASRYMFEEPQHMSRFQYLKSYVPDINLALFATYAIQAYSKEKPEAEWTNTLTGHCAPLGRHPTESAYGFLNGELVHSDIHATHHSHQCFKTSRPLSGARKLDAWLDLFTKEANRGLKAA